MAAVLALTLAALSLGAYDLLRENTQYWLGQAESRLEVVIYFKDGLDQTKAMALAAALKAIPEVQELTLVSPADAAKELSKDAALADFFGVLGGDNPLPWSARVKASAADVTVLNSLAEKAKALDGVSDVDWGQDSTEAILKWMKLLRSGLLALGLALGLSAALVTASVIRLTVHARREEISIMRMVGASAAFIRIPFLLEGLLQGLLGGALGASLLAALASFMVSHARQELQLDLNLYLPFGVSPDFGLRLLALGALLGLFGSVVAMSGRLKDGA